MPAELTRRPFLAAGAAPIASLSARAAAVALLGVSLLFAAQGQQPSSRAGWPCEGHPDPSYFRMAEATGGHFFLFHPSEVGDAGAIIAGSMSRDATLLRAGGQLAPGLHEFVVPVDTAARVLFSISVQCLQVIEIVRPTGELLQAADAAVEHHQFEAGRIVTVANPAPGEWRLRLSGSRLFLVIVQASSALRLSRPEFAPPGPPRPGIAQAVRVRLSGEVRDVHARLVTQGFHDLASVPLRVDGDETFAGEVQPPSRPFRLVVSGTDAGGLRFQRVHAPLFEPAAP